MRIGEYLQIGKKMKTLRKQHSYSQRAMAIELDLSFSTYSNYENGYSEPPIEILEQFCTLLNITLEDLFGLKLGMPKITSIKTFSELLAILIDLDQKGLSIKGNTTYSQEDNQLTAHLTLDITNAQLATFIPDWNKVNENLNSGKMNKEEYDIWLKDTLNMFNVPIDEYLSQK